MTLCTASASNIPEPGRIRCGANPARTRSDGLCHSHGKKADQGQPNAPALDSAPTRSSLWKAWAGTTALQKRQAYQRAASTWPNTSMSEHQVMGQLCAWYEFNPEMDPDSKTP